jgi:hypothetical protein
VARLAGLLRLADSDDDFILKGAGLGRGAQKLHESSGGGLAGSLLGSVLI